MPNPPDFPIEYTTGEVVFFWKKFRVTPAVLIPRLETEGLVRRARTIIREKNIKTVVDIGTGSGIIGTSCADLVDQTIFLDISPEALSIAQENYTTHFWKKPATFLESDLLSNLDLSEHSNEPILLLANLPYIKAEDWGNMSPDTRYEPELALFGWEGTGFEMYETLFAQIQERYKNHTLPDESILIIEFGFDQREIAEKIIASYGWPYEFFADYSWIERFCEIHIWKQ